MKRQEPQIKFPGDPYEDKKILEIENNFKKILYEEVKKIDEKFEKKETRLTEILAIFITLFTFISVNVNIFTRVQDVHSAVWFMLLFTMCSLLLLSCLFLVISDKKNYFIIGILVLSILCLTGLLVATKYIPSWSPTLNDVQK